MNLERWEPKAFNIGETMPHKFKSKHYMSKEILESAIDPWEFIFISVVIYMVGNNIQ
jgi:hypothetical protein